MSDPVIETPVVDEAAAAAAATAAAAVAAKPASEAGSEVDATAAASAKAATASAAPARAAGFMDEPEDDAATAEAARVAAEAETARRAALTQEQRDAEDKAAKEKEEAEKPKDDAVVYTDFKLPDGVEPDGALLDKAKSTFAAQGLTQEQAQAVIDLYSGDVLGVIKTAAEKPYEVWRETQEAWTKEALADPEFGGPKLQASKASIAKAIDTLLPDKTEAKAFRAAMSFTGATNNPAVIRFVARVGQRISEGKFVSSNGPAAPPKAAGEVFFDHPTSKPTTNEAAA